MVIFHDAFQAISNVSPAHRLVASSNRSHPLFLLSYQWDYFFTEKSLGGSFVQFGLDTHIYVSAFFEKTNE